MPNRHSTESEASMKIVVQGMEHCTDCSHHVIEPDPDPIDWFCDDDVKIRCKLSSATYRGNCREEPYVTVGCRPFYATSESEIPGWCPLLVQSESKVA